MSSHFMSFYQNVRSHVENPLELDWILHTSLGPLHMQRLEANVEEGIVSIHCRDEADQYRYVSFTEAQIAAFPIEVKRRGQVQQGNGIGFQFTGTSEEVSKI